MDNNLCLYCGLPGHQAKTCTALPNKRPYPGAPVRQLETVPEGEPSTPDLDIGDLNINSVTTFQVADAMMADPTPTQNEPF